MTTVPYEASLVPSEGSGNTVYDPGFPIPAVQFHGTDMAELIEAKPSEFVQWTDLDYEIGGAPGLADRNAYSLHGIENYTDAHDFRGDHATIPLRDGHGANGDVGGDDYSDQYAQAIASDAYPDVTREESWANISERF